MNCLYCVQVALYARPLKGYQLIHLLPIRALLAWMPKCMLPGPEPWGGVLKVRGC